jgi:agmatine deiminase
MKLFAFIALLIAGVNMELLGQSYTMPAETLLHEGTWLQWPHHYEYGIAYRNSLDAAWVAMTAALVQGENVHIVAYNATEQTRITNLLNAAGVSLINVDFYLFPTNDVWIRDNGPIFVRDTCGTLHIGDFGFNGWGGKFNSNLCNPIPTHIGNAIGVELINLNAAITIEGGAYELDGNGVFLACKSSTLSQSPANSVRNAGMTQSQAETILAQYLGVTKFIWLNGYTGTADITDAHIDGFAKFANENTLVTMNNADLLYWGLSATDITTLYGASNSNNIPYNKIYVPLTQNDVITTNGTNLGYKGSYCNYYIANTVVLVPNYNDPNDAVANNIIQALYPDRTVVGIDMRNLYENGGMVHCVTQQQPVTCLNNEPIITGNVVVCGLVATTYSVSPILPCATYQWVVNNGTIISGGGINDTTCTVQWNNGTAGNIQVLQTTP